MDKGKLRRADDARHRAEGERRKNDGERREYRKPEKSKVIKIEDVTAVSQAKTAPKSVMKEIKVEDVVKESTPFVFHIVPDKNASKRQQRPNKGHK